MKTILKTAAIGIVALTLSATSASAFTTWSTFESQGYKVKARYNAGTLNYITAKNTETGESFKGKVNLAGIATIETSEGVRRIDVKAIEKRLENRTTLQDLAQAN